MLNKVATFDVILRKIFCSFVNRCYKSNNKLISSLIASECFINSSYYEHYILLFYLKYTHRIYPCISHTFFECLKSPLSIVTRI